MGIRGRRKGQTTARPRKGSARNRIWMSMRILRKFTVPDLCRASLSGKENTQGFVRRLVVHGYVAKVGGGPNGFAGSYQTYGLAKNPGPFYPTRCDRCGRMLSEPCEISTGEDHER